MSIREINHSKYSLASSPSQNFTFSTLNIPSSSPKSNQYQSKLSVHSSESKPPLYVINSESQVSLEDLKNSYQYVNELELLENKSKFFHRRLSWITNDKEKILFNERRISFPSRKYIRILTNIAIEFEFDVNIPFQSGLTLLHYCIFHCLHLEIKQLLVLGASIEIITGETYISSSSSKSSKQSGRHFLKSIEDRTEQSFLPKGLNALELAMEIGDQKTLQILQQSKQYSAEKKINVEKNEMKEDSEVQQTMYLNENIPVLYDPNYGSTPCIRRLSLYESWLRSLKLAKSNIKIELEMIESKKAKVTKLLSKLNIRIGKQLFEKLRIVLRLIENETINVAKKKEMLKNLNMLESKRKEMENEIVFSIQSYGTYNKNEETKSHSKKTSQLEIVPSYDVFTVDLSLSRLFIRGTHNKEEQNGRIHVENLAMSLGKERKNTSCDLEICLKSIVDVQYEEINETERTPRNLFCFIIIWNEETVLGETKLLQSQIIKKQVKLFFDLEQVIDQLQIFVRLLSILNIHQITFNEKKNRKLLSSPRESLLPSLSSPSLFSSQVVEKLKNLNLSKENEDKNNERINIVMGDLYVNNMEKVRSRQSKVSTFNEEIKSQLLRIEEVQRNINTCYEERRNQSQLLNIMLFFFNLSKVFPSSWGEAMKKSYILNYFSNDCDSLKYGLKPNRLQISINVDTKIALYSKDTIHTSIKDSRLSTEELFRPLRLILIEMEKLSPEQMSQNYNSSVENIEEKYSLDKKISEEKLGAKPKWTFISVPNEVDIERNDLWEYLKKIWGYNYEIEKLQENLRNLENTIENEENAIYCQKVSSSKIEDIGGEALLSESKALHNKKASFNSSLNATYLKSLSKNNARMFDINLDDL